MCRLVEILARAQDREVGLWLVEQIQPDWTLTIHDRCVATAQDEVPHEPGHDRHVPRTDGHHADHLPVDEFERIAFSQNTHAQHLLVLVRGESTAADFHGHGHASPAILPKPVADSVPRPSWLRGAHLA